MPDYRYSCPNWGKTYIGPPQPGMMCNCTPPKLMIGAPYVPPVIPLSRELLEQMNIQNATDRRGRLCQAWGIVSHSHRAHGSNFSAPQTLVQLINNIVEPLQGAERQRVRDLVIAQFSYDIDTQMMT